MNEPPEKQFQATRAADNKDSSNFESIFFAGDNAVPVRVPDYQRAYSWEQKQIELFIGDLKKYRDFPRGDYYFGHFIIEQINGTWETVDGQQRVTTFVLFLMVCRHLSPTLDHPAFSLIERFFTVSYDDVALKTIARNLPLFFEYCRALSSKDKLADAEIISRCSLKLENFTLSQQRIASALKQFYQAFEKGGLLDGSRMADYIEVVMKANCSYHPAGTKSVAVNIFEMQNTRGVPLTTLEIIKAMLMKFVYDYGRENRELKVEQIQAEFGEIYGMEERVAEHSFRGEMTMEQLLRLHLRVVDDGTKKTANEFRSPATDANSDALVEYVDSRLHYIDGDKKKSTIKEEDGAQYALNLAKEFKRSVRIISENLPEWDKENSLVGDVLILDQDLSCQFFLLICRRLGGGLGEANGRIGIDTLSLWEKLLFIRDFHEKYLHLSYRDDFPALFASCGADENQITDVIKRYLADGFRPDRTKGLQSIVAAYLNDHRVDILEKAFHWWKSKMIYAIYKYEISEGANIRKVMKGTISVEHILPLDWNPDWAGDEDVPPHKLSDTELKSFQEKIGSCINGIGNLLLLTPGENTSQGKNHPAKKRYKKYCEGGSYKKHDENAEKWRSSKDWSTLISARGEEIFEFMLGKLVK